MTATSTTVKQFVQALWDFPGKESGDLSFHAGDIVEVIQKENEGWWRGKIYRRVQRDHKGDLDNKDKHKKEGVFPCNYVVPISAKQAEAVKPLHHLREYLSSACERNSVVSFRTSDSIRQIAVTAAERKIVSQHPPRVRSLYKVEVLTSQLSVVEKRFHEFLELYRQLEELCPYVELKGVLLSDHLYIDKKTAHTMEARRKQLDTFVRIVMQDQNAAALLLTFLLPERSAVAASTVAPVQHERHATLPTISPTIEANIPTHRMSSSADASAVCGGGGAITPRNNIPESDAAYVIKKHASNEQIGRTHQVMLNDLDAFDDLMEKGYSITVIEQDNEKRQPIYRGQRVQMSYTAILWDGAKDNGAESERCESVEFIVLDPLDALGPKDCYQADGLPIPPGLHAACTELSVGTSAAIILAPNQAFGKDGVIDRIPELAHMVYKIKIQTCRTPTEEDREKAIQAAKTHPKTHTKNISSDSSSFVTYRGREITNEKPMAKLNHSSTVADITQTSSSSNNQDSEQLVRLGGRCVPMSEAQKFIDAMISAQPSSNTAGHGTSIRRSRSVDPEQKSPTQPRTSIFGALLNRARRKTTHQKSPSIDSQSKPPLSPPISRPISRPARPKPRITTNHEPAQQDRSSSVCESFEPARAANKSSHSWPGEENSPSDTSRQTRAFAKSTIADYDETVDSDTCFISLPIRTLCELVADKRNLLDAIIWYTSEEELFEIFRLDKATFAGLEPEAQMALLDNFA